MFNMTVEGCEKAIEYLKQINKYDEFMNNKTSIDGYSLVAYANSFQELQDEDNSK